MDALRDESPTFRILFVCTGNICRSPFADILGRHLLAERLGAAAGGFAVASAGVDAVVDSAMHPASRAALEAWNLYRVAEGFRARQLTRAELAAADLILGAEPGHRSAAVQMWPRALASAFSLREFARLVATVDLGRLPLDPVTRARALVGAARANRGMAPPPPPEDDAIPDPIGGSAQLHLSSARLCAESLVGIVTALAPPEKLTFRALANSNGI